MMTKFLLGGAAAITLAFGVAPALAQSPGAAPAAPGQAGGQRAQTRAEIPAQVQALFARLDVNRDGLIAREEAQAKRPAVAGKPAQRVEGQRAAADPMAAFDRMDSDRNGAISRDEYSRQVAQRQQRRAAGVQRSGAGVGLAGRLFDAADVNRDSRVSVAEATAAAFRRFDLADVNRDGRLTGEERRQARGQRKPG